MGFYAGRLSLGIVGRSLAFGVDGWIRLMKKSTGLVKNGRKTFIESHHTTDHPWPSSGQGVYILMSDWVPRIGL